MTVERRLSAARLALLGKRPPRGRGTVLDEVALFNILSEVRKPEIDTLMRSLVSRIPEAARTEWQAAIDRKPDSIRQAARKQAKSEYDYPKTTPHATDERLRRKVIGSALTTQDMADIEGIIHGDSQNAQVIDDVADGLRRLGVKVTGRMGKHQGH
jgi:hypothetical protein